MYLLYPKNSTWRRLRAISTPRSEKCPYFLMTVRPLSWAFGHGTEMLPTLKNLFSTWIFSDIFSYDSPKKCTIILCAVNLWLKPVSVTGLTPSGPSHTQSTVQPVPTILRAGCTCFPTTVEWERLELKSLQGGSNQTLRVSKCGQLSQQTRRLDPILFQCCPAPLAVGQYWNSIGSNARVCWAPHRCLSTPTPPPP